jgi:phage repressor protein C with HTH and peptisase S24 domain
MRGEEVKKILEEDGHQLAEVAEKLNISPQNFYNWLGVQDIKTGILEKIARAIDKNIYYFIDKQSLITQERDEFPDGAIRYYDIDASAGPVEMFEPGTETKFKKIIIPGYGDCDFALNVWGDSMNPVLHNGEIILCKQWKERFIEFGYIYLIITTECYWMIKYIQPGNDDSKITCESENAFYKPFEINKTDILKLYVVKGHINRRSI